MDSLHELPTRIIIAHHQKLRWILDEQHDVQSARGMEDMRLSLRLRSTI